MMESTKRTDPPESESQRRAMWAAAEGRGNLGIPKKVGKEFAEADPGGKLPERKDSLHSRLKAMDAALEDCSTRMDACEEMMGDSARADAGDIVRGPHQTPLNGRFNSKEEAQAWLNRRLSDESFEKLEGELAHKKGVKDPAALAAYIGREHGKIK